MLRRDHKARIHPTSRRTRSRNERRRRARLLATARAAAAAVAHAHSLGLCTVDDVVGALVRAGHDLEPFRPFLGNIFRDGRWRPTPWRARVARFPERSRRVRIWQLATRPPWIADRARRRKNR